MLERRRWEEAQRVHWNHFIFTERFQMEDRWRIAHNNIGEQHARAAMQLRSSGSLARLCQPPPGSSPSSSSSASSCLAAMILRDCTPSLQPHEQAIMFEQQYSSGEPQSFVSQGFEIIDSHFTSAANGTIPKPNANGVSNNQDGATVPASTLAHANRGPGRVQEPALSVEAESAMKSAGPLSDSLGKDAAKQVAPELQEGVVGEDVARTAPLQPSASFPAPSSNSRGRVPSSSSASSSLLPSSSFDLTDSSAARVSETSQQCRRRLSLEQRGYEGKHLVVLVHGYQGNSWDMRLLKNQIVMMHPHVQVFVSTANEGMTEGDVRAMGHRLSVELDEYIVESCRDLGRLSFVCHSLGGLITRAALTAPLLQRYLDKLHAYISLATPHCGYLLSDNSMLGTGMWLLRKWNKSTCLTQLAMSDSTDAKSTMVYELASAPSLKFFRHVYLLASHQDRYAPFNSARIELVTGNMVDRRKASTYQAMVSAMLAKIDDQRTEMRRIDVTFVSKKKFIDTLIGRQAHIQFLTDTNYIRMLLSLNPHLLQ